MELNVIDLSREDSWQQRGTKVRQKPDLQVIGGTEGKAARRVPREYMSQEMLLEDMPQRPPQRRPKSDSYARREPGSQVRKTQARPRPRQEVSRPRAPRSYEDPSLVRRQRMADARARQERLRRRKRRRRKQLAARLTVLLFLAGLIALLVFALVRLVTGTDKTDRVVETFRHNPKEQEIPKEEERTLKPFITEDFLTVNEYSRPGEALEEVNNIFVHYTANRGTSAAQNRSYFENLGTTGETSASAHFIIGYDGEIIQCIPLDEIGYAVMGRNYDSISIECCYLQDDGKFTEETYQSLIRLCAWLLDEYKLTPEDMMRHYDEGGKKCPLYFTEHVEAWEQFKRDLGQYIAEQAKL